MNSKYDDLTGRDDVQNFLKMMKEKNIEDQKLKYMLEKMVPTSEKVQNFLNEQMAILMEANKQGLI
mgnify:FL=1